MILDTVALSDWARSDNRLLTVLPGPRQLVVPTIVVGEYLYGLRTLPRAAQAHHEAWLRDLVKRISVASINLATTEPYATIRRNVEEKGQTIPVNDMWIAAVAMQLGLPVLSRDAHFDRVDGLARVSW